jgi:hypothetical protein
VPEAGRRRRHAICGTYSTGEGGEYMGGGKCLFLNGEKYSGFVGWQGRGRGSGAFKVVVGEGQAKTIGVEVTCP